MGKMTRILIWGIGRDYNRHLNLLKYWEHQNIEIVGITDKNLPDVETIDGWKVVKIEQLNQIEFDYILVMSEKFYLEILSDISKNGIKKNKIMSCKILDIPYFDWEKYIEIKKKEISILCNNCLGGIVYHTLALECKSPCKNLAIPDQSFLKLINNVPYYMELEPEFLRWQVDPHSLERFPVIKLDDIEIWCNHDTSLEEAVEKWNRRKKKINYENMIFMMYTEDEKTVQNFVEDSDDHRIVFVPELFPVQTDHRIFPLKMFSGQKEFWEVVNSSATLGKNSCNYKLLDMLNGKKEYRL